MIDPRVEGLDEFKSSVSQVEAWTVPSHVPAVLDVTISQVVDKNMETDHEFE